MLYSSDTFKSYSELIADMVGIRSDDFVMINFDLAHAELVETLCEVCYALGAKYVDLNLESSIGNYSRSKFLKPEHASFSPEYLIPKYQEYINNKTCVISIRSPQDKLLEPHIDQKNLATLLQNRRKKLGFFTKEVLQDSFSWLVCACPTKAWAKNIFPNLSEDEGYGKLFTILQSILRLDKSDARDQWRQQQQVLKHRREILNSKKYKALHFVTDETDLTVSLSPSSNWLGGAHTSKNGRYFQANLPTEEVYTTPDCRNVRGTVKVTRELEVLGTTVSDARFTFEAGKVKSFEASKGQKALEIFLATDPRNSYLGEIALVDCDSPIWKSGIVFNNILLDENSGVHFALGSAYPSGYGIENPSEFTTNELLEIGCNVSESQFHIDFTFGSENMNVYGVTETNEEAIIENGKFAL